MNDVLGAAHSKMNAEFQADGKLAEKFLAEADAKNLYALYQKRCAELCQVAKAFETMMTLRAGIGERKDTKDSHDAIASMERVSLAAIALSASIFENFGKQPSAD